MQTSNPEKQIFKKQTQKRPGLDKKMDPQPVFMDDSPGSSKLLNKKCIITGGDSGIGRAVAVMFAREGADVAIMYMDTEHQDAIETARVIEDHHKRTCLLVPTDVSNEKNCTSSVRKITKTFSNIDVLVNNAAVQYPVKDFLDISTEKMIETFSVNIFSMFWITQEVLPYMNEGSSIINTSSVTAYRGSDGLIDYSSTKGAIVSFTRSLSAKLASKNIRVNGVAPGPVWTPLIASSFSAKKVSAFGTDVPLGRPAQPIEIAPAFLFLASKDASYITGQFIHVNGGEIVNG
jgi:NAD(P)-dependent dehydrogenase (short-subunit alcohol dehydrogenase family)